MRPVTRKSVLVTKNDAVEQTVVRPRVSKAVSAPNPWPPFLRVSQDADGRPARIDVTESDYDKWQRMIAEVADRHDTTEQRSIDLGELLRARGRTGGVSTEAAPLRASEGFDHWCHEFVRRCEDHMDSFIIVDGKVGSGKPLGRGQGVLMHDGSIKTVEEIVVGDVVMGPNSQLRHVLQTIAGHGPLVRVIPHKTEPFIVGAEHPLTVRISGRNVPLGRPRAKRPVPQTANYDLLQQGGWLKDVPARHYLGLSNRTGDKLLQSESLAFSHRATLPLSPYLLGLLLGDGGMTGRPRVSFTKRDPDVLRAYEEELSRLGLVPLRYEKLQSKGTFTLWVNGRSPLWTKLVELGLAGKDSETKFIPDEYLRATEAERMELLAGLMDTDGYVEPKGGCDYTSKSRVLADNVSRLARSLGFKTFARTMRKHDQNMTWGTYYGVTIVGDTNRIPLRSAFKSARLKAHHPFKEVLVEGFRVEPAGEGEHYCIMVDGDHRFLMSNFIFTHNSSLALSVGTAIDPTFLPNLSRRLVYSPAALIDALTNIEPAQVLVYDESYLGLANVDSGFQKETKLLLKAFSMSRFKSAICILVVPSIHQLQLQIRNSRATHWIAVVGRGLAKVHEKFEGISYRKTSELIGYSRSETAPYLTWSKIPEASALWRSYEQTKLDNWRRFMAEAKSQLAGGPANGKRGKHDDIIMNAFAQGSSLNEVKEKFGIGYPRAKALQKLSLANQAAAEPLPEVALSARKRISRGFRAGAVRGRRVAHQRALRRADAAASTALLRRNQ